MWSCCMGLKSGDAISGDVIYDYFLNFYLGFLSGAVISGCCQGMLSRPAIWSC